MNPARPMNYMDLFRGSALAAGTSNFQEYFGLLAKVAKDAFNARLVSVWDNNVFGKSLVHLSSEPQRQHSRDRFTMPTDGSLTGLAVERLDIVTVEDIRKPIGHRALVNNDIVSEFGVSTLVSIPITNAFDPQLVTFVIDLLYQEGASLSIFHDRTMLNWLRRYLALSLDYLLYRVDDGIRYRVETSSGTVSGISGLFDVIFPELKLHVTCVNASVMSYYHQRKELVLERSSDGQPSITIELGRVLNGVEPQDIALRCIEQTCIERRQSVMIPEPVVSEGNGLTKGPFQRWPHMATPILSATGDVIGILQCKEPKGESFARSFSMLDLHCLEIFAQAIAPSLERFIRLREGSTPMQVVKEVSSAAVSGGQLDTILKKCISSIVDSFDAAVGSIYLLERKNGHEKLIMKAATSIHEPLVGKAEYDIGEGTTGDIAKGKILNFKTIEERRNYPNRKGKYDCEHKIPKEYAPFQGFLGVPIQMGQEVLGIWKVENPRPTDRHPDPYFTDEDEQIAQVLSSFLAYIIQNSRYRQTMYDSFQLLAKSSIEIESASNEEDAILAVMDALNHAGWKDALLCIYEPATDQLNGLISAGPTWSKMAGECKVKADNGNILGRVLQSNEALFVPNPGSDEHFDLPFMKRSDSKAQYILPLRLSDEKIGTLQVHIGAMLEMDPEEELVLRAFAAHLAVAISRVRSIRRSVDLTSQVMSSSRFLVAETLSSMVVHSLKHKLERIIAELEADIKRKDVRDRREVLEPLSKWHQNLLAGKKDLEAALQFVRFGGSDAIAKAVDIHPLIQHSIDTWITFLAQSNCKVTSEPEAGRSQCRVSRHAFGEILSVLLVNSVQAFSKHIRIRTYNEENVEAPPGNHIREAFCLECSDDGTGISTDNPEQLFEATYTTKHEKFGTGLGLFIARRLAREGGGDLEAVYPNPTSKGATFRLTLPVYIGGRAQ